MSEEKTIFRHGVPFRLTRVNLHVVTPGDRIDLTTDGSGPHIEVRDLKITNKGNIQLYASIFGNRVERLLEDRKVWKVA